jgi:outer membrane receptor protein involved in Fe transport
MSRARPALRRPWSPGRIGAAASALTVAAGMLPVLLGAPAAAQERTQTQTQTPQQHPALTPPAPTSSPREPAPNLPATIEGRVLAADRDAPLDFTNVYIPGMRYGTMAVGGGRFWLRGLPAGTYTIKASYITYEVGEITVTVAAGESRQIEFRLTPMQVRLDEYEIRAERQLLEVEQTGTARRLTSEAIDALPMDDVVGLVALQPGVALEDNQIHIRGGRAEDTSFVVDGITVQDPLGGAGYGVSFNEDLINEIEVLTGGFSAEYGQAVSGVVNITTKEGTDRVEGKVSYKTDALAPNGLDYDTEVVRATLSGPNPITEALEQAGLNLPGEHTFIISASADLLDGYLPNSTLSNGLSSPVVAGRFWTPRANNDWSVLGKLTWQASPSQKLNFTYTNQQGIGQGFFLAGEGFPRKWQNALNDYNVFTTQNIVSQLTWKHVLSEHSYYEVTLGRQFSRLHSNKNGNDDFSTYVGPVYNEHEGQSGQFEAGAFLPGGDDDRWHDHYTEIYTLKADYEWLARGANQFKTGIEFSTNEMQLIDLSGRLGSPPPGFLAANQDIFKVHPLVGAGYFQDRIKYRGLVLNLGARLDAWAPGREVDAVMQQPEEYVFIFPEVAQSYMEKTYSAFGRRWKARLSPRVGVSFPVSRQDKFFFNYGHFSQWPRYNYVYPQLQTRFATGLQLLGNPDLDPKVTVQFETGIQHEFEKLWSVELTFYSNDIYGYAQSVSLAPFTIDPSQTPDPNDESPVTVSPVRYFNADAARSVGAEISIVKSTAKYLSGSLSVDLQRSTGTSSDADASYVAAQLGQANPNYESEQGIRRVPLLWDRPWSVTLNLDYTVGPKLRPAVFGWTVPGNWSLNLLYRIWSGARYTELTLRESSGTISVQSSPDIYGQLGPHRSTLDLRLSKHFDFSARARLSFFIEGHNLLNHDNWRRVNAWTGGGYHRGNWDGSLAAQRQTTPELSVNNQWYVEDVVDPSYRTDPREFFMGVSYKW